MGGGLYYLERLKMEKNKRLKEPTEHILDRTYINFIKKIVHVFKSKSDLLTIGAEPLEILKLEEFEEKYKEEIKKWDTEQ